MSYRIAFSSFALDHKLPPQHELPEGDKTWRQFNASFENLSLEPQEIANFVFLGHPFTTWHKDHWRDSRNFMCGQHIGLDFDTGDYRSSLEHLSRQPFIANYAQLIYTTPSHRPESPRARVLFCTDAPIQQAQNYADAAAALIWLFGGSDPKCKDPVRFFYGSKQCEFIWMADNTLPIAKIKTIIRDHKDFLTKERQRREERKAKITHTTEFAEVEDALRGIPPWGIEYDEWLSILMAIHAEYGDNGLDLAEAWAEGAAGEVRAKWRSFKRDGNTAGKIGLGTIFAIAKKCGWTRKTM